MVRANISHLCLLFCAPSLSFLLFLPFLGLSSPGVRCNSKYSNSKDIGENVRVSSGEKCRPPERSWIIHLPVTGGEKIGRETRPRRPGLTTEPTDSQNSRPLPARLFFPPYRAPFSSLSLCRFVYIFVSLKISKNKLAPGIKLGQAHTYTRNNFTLVSPMCSGVFHPLRPMLLTYI